MSATMMLMTFLKSRLWSALVLLAFVAAAVPARAQITTNTALPVGKGETIIRLQTKVLRATGDPMPTDRDLRVTAFPLVGVYGVSGKLALFGVLPVFDKNLDVTMPTGRVTRNATGVGDARLFARYTLFQHNRRGLTVRLAPFAGIELPTGTDDVRDNAGPLPRPLQLGSGSWDPFVGVVLTRQSFAGQVDVSASYKRNTEADGFRFGDEARLDVAAKVRVLPRRLGRGLPRFLYVALESNLIGLGRNEVGGADDPNSGGLTWYLAPGLQYATRRFILGAALQLPVVQDLNGAALENDAILTLSVRFSL